MQKWQVLVPHLSFGIQSIWNTTAFARNVELQAFQSYEMSVADRVSGPGQCLDWWWARGRKRCCSELLWQRQQRFACLLIFPVPYTISFLVKLEAQGCGPWEDASQTEAEAGRGQRQGEEEENSRQKWETADRCGTGLTQYGYSPRQRESTIPPLWKYWEGLGHQRQSNQVG